MALELIRDTLKTDRVIGEEMSQAVVEEDIVVPDSKPDINKVLSINGEVVITDKKITDNRVEVDGVINVRILYTSQEGEQPLYYMEGNFGVNQQLDVPGAESRMDTLVSAEIEHMDCAVVNSRKLNVKCVMHLSGKVLDGSQIDVVKDIKGIQDIQVLKDYIEISDIVGENSSYTTVRQEFELPADKPQVREILKTSVTVGERDSRVTEDRVNIQGIINVSSLYIGDDDESSINRVKYQIPFSNYLEVAGAGPGMKGKIRYSVEDFYSTVKENAEGERNIIEYEVVVKADGKVETTRQMEILADAYSPTRQLDVRKSSLKLKKPMESVVEDISIKEEIDIPAECPGIAEICDVEAVPALVDFEIDEGLLAVEGFMTVRILYTTDGAGDRVYMYEDEIPLRHTMELPDENGQMDIDVNLYLEDLQHRLLGDDLVEIRGRVKAEVDISQVFDREVMLDVEESEGERRTDASIVVYVVQQGDTLWNVAKRYNTTIEELVKINDIQESQNLIPGDKLIISRIVKYKLS